MQRFILTGAPGAGKTVLLRRLELAGYGVVEEAATDHIALADALGVARHWEAPGFIDEIVALQRARQARADAWSDAVVVFDRSPICTWALSEFLGLSPTPVLTREAERVVAGGVYERRVFLVELMGFVTPTQARRITFEDAVRFEAAHVAAYARFGFELVRVAPADVETRFAAVVAGMAAASFETTAGASRS